MYNFAENGEIKQQEEVPVLNVFIYVGSLYAGGKSV